MFAHRKVEIVAILPNITRMDTVNRVIRLAKVAQVQPRISVYHVKVLYYFKVVDVSLNATTVIIPLHNLQDRFASLACTLAKAAFLDLTVPPVKMVCSFKAGNVGRPALKVITAIEANARNVISRVKLARDRGEINA